MLDGEKTWISNGGIADFYVVFARTGEAPGAKGISAFIVAADTPGFDDRRAHRGDRAASAGALALRRMPRPGVALIGKPGEGFQIAMSTLDVFRSTVGAAALGFARRALDESARRAPPTRKLFGAPMAELQMVQAKLADMALDVDAAALLVYRAAWTKDMGAARVTREAAMAKLRHRARAGRHRRGGAAHGGDGVRRGHVVERLYREIRALRIYEGASEVQKVVIARQVVGAVRA